MKISAILRTSTLAVLLTLVGCGDDDSKKLKGAHPEGHVGDETVSLEVINETRETLVGLYLRPAGERAWGSNQLDGNKVGSGETFTLYDIPCDEAYDLKSVLDDRQELTDEDVYFECGEDKELTLSYTN